jgi:hypothetical protein
MKEGFFFSKFVHVHIHIHIPLFDTKIVNMAFFNHGAHLSVMHSSVHPRHQAQCSPLA